MLIGNEKRADRIRNLIFAATIIIASLLQNFAGFLPRPLNVQVVFLLPALVTVSMHTFEVPAIFFGLFAGLMADAVSAAPQGFNALLFTAFAFIASAFINTVMRNNVVTAFLLNAVSTVSYFFFYWLITVVFKGYEGALGVLLKFYLPSAGLTILFGPIFYIFIHFVSRKTRFQTL